MKIFLIFATIFGLLVSAHAQTTVRVTLSNSEIWDVEYQTGRSFTDDSTSIDDAPWWNNEDDVSPAGWATALYNANNSLPDVRFAFDTISSGSLAAFYDQANGNSLQAAAVGADASYAIGATLVPAPFPILGILPVVGFLKRMRRRQKAS